MAELKLVNWLPSPIPFSTCLICLTLLITKLGHFNDRIRRIIRYSYGTNSTFRYTSFRLKAIGFIVPLRRSLLPGPVSAEYLPAWYSPSFIHHFDHFQNYTKTNLVILFLTCGVCVCVCVRVWMCVSRSKQYVVWSQCIPSTAAQMDKLINKSDRRKLLFFSLRGES